VIVHKNHATLKLFLNGFLWTYSESRIELQNLQILKKMLEKWGQLLLSEQPCELKSFQDVALKYCWSWKNTLGKLAVVVNTWRHLIQVLNERSVTESGNFCPLWLVIHKSVSWHFSRCCALKQTGPFASEIKVNMCLFKLNLRSDDLMFHSWHQSMSIIIFRLRKVEFFKYTRGLAALTHYHWSLWDKWGP